ncbi:MAG: molybdate ABC transporter substrate-binding protein [Desulfovibrio sp.]|nr:molybdate ABC transporter substrate-binding protein [Desulfovibrio sp.]
MKKLLLAVIGLLALAAQATAAELTVSAAASLANAFDELKQLFEQEHPGLVINCNYAASDPLLRQIAAGAPVDVFASADQATMNKAEAEQLVAPGTRHDFAANSLVVIVPSGSAKPQTLADLRRMQRIAIGNPDSVPAGRYARQALEKAELWQELEPRFILADSVRQALAYVSQGEADAGIVYGTDGRQQADKVDIALIVEGHEPVAYPIAVMVTGNNQAAGQQFINFVMSQQGQAILGKYGFGKP